MEQASRRRSHSATEMGGSTTDTAGAVERRGRARRKWRSIVRAKKRGLKDAPAEAEDLETAGAETDDKQQASETVLMGCCSNRADEPT